MRLVGLVGMLALLMTALFILLLALVSPVPVAAHDAGRPDLNAWFDHLASGKGLCCSSADGTALNDSDWESVNDPNKPSTHYRVFIESQWWDVPDDAVIKEPNRAGHTMVWPIYYRGFGGGSSLGITIRCFMPGAMT